MGTLNSSHDLKAKTTSIKYKTSTQQTSFWSIFKNSKTDANKIRRNRRLMRQRAMEAMTGDSHIDRVSRVMFPLTFFLFNVVYWFAYLSHRQAEIVHNTVDHKNDHNQNAD